MDVTPEYIKKEIANMKDQLAMHLSMYHKADGAIQALQQILLDMESDIPTIDISDLTYEEALMSEPIILTKGGETMTAYGTAQAAALVNDGWRVGNETNAVELPRENTEPKAPPKKRTAVKTAAKKG